MNNQQSPKLVSLFSGCGGMDKGFENAGFSRVWANDFDKDAQAVFRLNFGDIDGRDIREVPVEDIPECDIITAGFPCQPFSNAGNRRGVYDARGELYLECLRIIESKKPKAVLFENVKGLISSKHQSGQKLIDVIKEDLEKLGYAVNYKVVNASDYGVPQNRERLILVAFRNDLNKTFVFPPIQEDKSKLTLRHISFKFLQEHPRLVSRAMSSLQFNVSFSIVVDSKASSPILFSDGPITNSFIDEPENDNSPMASIMSGISSFSACTSNITSGPINFTGGNFSGMSNSSLVALEANKVCVFQSISKSLYNPII